MVRFGKLVSVNNAECVDLSAAFAYFVLQSFFPLLLIALSVAARVFGKTESVDNVLDSVTQVCRRQQPVSWIPPYGGW